MSAHGGDATYTIRFSPRRPKSIWSQINIKRVEELKAEGRMHPAGLAAYEARDPEAAEPLFVREPQRGALGQGREGVSRQQEGVGEFLRLPSVLSTSGDLVGGQREEARDARAPPRDADRRFRCRPEDQAADAADAAKDMSGERLFIFGFGYSARAIAARMRPKLAEIFGTTRDPEKIE